MLLCATGGFAQSAQQPVTAKANANSTAFDSHDFSGVWNPAPRMQPKGEVNPLDLGGHPNPLPPFAPAGQLKYEANKKFIDAGAVLDCDPYGTARNFFTPRPFENILLSRFGEQWETFSATMYLLWDPGLPSTCTPASTDPNLHSTKSTCTSIPVPLSSVTWHWSGCAINTLAHQSNGTNWTLSTLNGCPVDTLGTVQLSNSVSGFPIWTSVANP
jgi:hypothetical protein